MQKLIILFTLIANFSMAQNITSYTKYDDGLLKIDTGTESYLMSNNGKELNVLDREDEFFLAVYLEEDIESLLIIDYKLRVAEDETGIYFYLYEVLIGKYERINLNYQSSN